MEQFTEPQTPILNRRDRRTNMINSANYIKRVSPSFSPPSPIAKVNLSISNIASPSPNKTSTIEKNHTERVQELHEILKELDEKSWLLIENPNISYSVKRLFH